MNPIQWPLSKFLSKNQNAKKCLPNMRKTSNRFEVLIPGDKSTIKTNIIPATTKL